MARGLQRWGPNTSYAPIAIVDAKGDLIVASGADALARVAVGSDGQVLQADSAATNGVKWANRSRSVADTNTDVTVVNSAAEAIAATLAVPTTVAAGDVLHFRLAGDLLNNSGSNVTYQLKIKLGATTVLTGVATSVSSQTTRRQWWADIELLVVVAASDQRLAGEAYMGIASASNWAQGAGIGTSVGYGTAAEDLGAGKSIVLTAQMGTADVNADFRTHMATLEIVKR